MSSHRRPDTRRLPAACPACLRLLRLAHTRTILRHSSTERPASYALALSAAIASGLHSSQAHQLHGEYAQKASAGETALLHTSQVPPFLLAARALAARQQETGYLQRLQEGCLTPQRRVSTCPRSHPPAILDGARPELQAAPVDSYVTSGFRAPADS